MYTNDMYAILIYNVTYDIWFYMSIKTKVYC